MHEIMMETSGLALDTVHLGRSELLMKGIPSSSISLSFWSPPYFVGKQYERDETFTSWQQMLQLVIQEHGRVLRPGAFLVVNIADIRTFKDPHIPRFQAMNTAMQKSKVTREMILDAKQKYPDFNRNQLAALLGCSEQTVDRRLNGNNIRGGKYEVQTRLKLVGSYLERYGIEAGIYLYDHRIWAKDPAWANSKWTSNSLKSVDEYEDLYVFWKPGQQVIDRDKLSPSEWREWGSRGIWHIRSVRSNDDHEAKFPLELASKVIRLYSNEGDTVLDPFLGSGTTAIAAIEHKRRFIGIEKEPTYVELAMRNIARAKQQLRMDY